MVLEDLRIDEKPKPERLKHVIDQPARSVKEPQFDEVAVNKERGRTRKEGHAVPDVVLEPPLALAPVAHEARLKLVLRGLLEREPLLCFGGRPSVVACGPRVQVHPLEVEQVAFELRGFAIDHVVLIVQAVLAATLARSVEAQMPAWIHMTMPDRLSPEVREPLDKESIDTRRRRRNGGLNALGQLVRKDLVAVDMEHPLVRP